MIDVDSVPSITMYTVIFGAAVRDKLVALFSASCGKDINTVICDAIMAAPIPAQPNSPTAEPAQKGKAK